LLAASGSRQGFVDVCAFDTATVVDGVVTEGRGTRFAGLVKHADDQPLGDRWLGNFELKPGRRPSSWAVAGLPALDFAYSFTAETNAAPTVTVPGAQTATEDTPKNITGISIADTDGDAQAVTLSVTNGTLTLASTSGLTFTVGDGTNDAAMSFSGSVANINTALATVTYNPTANYNGAATLSIAADDGAGGTDSETIAITVSAVNDRPTMTTSGGSTAYTEGDPAIVVDSGLTVADVDDTNLEGAVVRISSGFHTGDLLTVVNQFGLSSTWFPGSQSLVIEGTATKAQYQAILRTVKYVSSSDNPTSVNRVVTFTVGDGNLDSTGVTKTITVTPVNDAPTITVPGAQTATEDTPKNITGISIADLESNAQTVTLSVTNGTLTLASTTGLTFTVGDGTADAIMTFSGSVTNINTALATVTYNPTANYAGSATLSIATNDGASGTDSDTVAITVSAVNDAPTITFEGGGASADVDVEEPDQAVATITASDPDSGDSITWSLNGGADAALFAIDSSTGELSFLDPSVEGEYEVIVRATDGSAATDDMTINVTVSSGVAAPDAPEGLILTPDETTPETRFTATWSDPSGGVTPDGYEVRFATTDVGFEAAAVAFDAPATPPKLFEALEPGQQYFVYVAAYVGTPGVDAVFGPAVSDSITTESYDPTDITSDGGGPTAVLYSNVGESLTITTVTATGEGTIVYSLGTGLNEAMFSIDSATGVVTAASLATSETLEIEVIAQGDGAPDSQIITLHVTNGDGAEAGYEPLETPGIEFVFKTPPGTLDGGEFYDDGNSPQNFVFDTTPSGSAALLLSLIGNDIDDTGDRIVFTAFGVSVWAAVYSVVENPDDTVNVNTYHSGLFPFPNGTTVLVQRRPVTP
jgi:hypothetical protein